MLIVQWFKLPDGDWVLATVVAILAPAFTDIALTLKRGQEEVYQEGLLKVVHRIIGTIIGAVTILIIIDNVHNIWLLSLILFVYLSAYLSFVKIKNYAFKTIFTAGMALLFLEIIHPAPDPTAVSLERIQNVFIGCLLSLGATSIWIAFSRKKSNLPLGRKGE